MRCRLLLSLGVVLGSFCSLARAEVPVSGSEALREQLVTRARAVRAEDFAYTRTVRTEQVGNGKTETRVLVERWDPAKSAEQRWTLLSVDGRAPTSDEQKSYSKSLVKRRQPYYGRVAGYFDNPSTATVDEHGRTVFHFAAMARETVMVSDADISSNASGEAVVNTSGSVPFIEEVRLHSTKPTRIKLIAKIDRFESVTRYRLMPDGKPAPIEASSEMSGSMLGQEGQIRTRITYSEQRAVLK